MSGLEPIIGIRQHADDGTLNDLNRFLEDVDQFFAIDQWVIGNLEMFGENAREIEERCGCSATFTDSEFRTLYRGIYQTIWGDFVGMQDGEVMFELKAIDSSYWVINSSNAEFFAHLLERYGEYVSPLAS